jgi:excisionase family DNA binding protein
MKTTAEKAPTTKVPADAAFYTIKELAERLKISEKSIRRLIKQKELIAHQFGRMWRISVADALTFERANRIS